MEETLLQLTPDQILADDNTRFNLKTSRKESLKHSILELGGVQEPIAVEPIEGAKKGQPQYRLTKGFYRHAAVAELNKEGQTLTLPAIVRVLGDPLLRLRVQLSENMDRENQSPMDQAVAIKKLLDAGVARADIRALFARPGGKKGTQSVPASNAWVNIVVGFLDLPKAIQEKIHDGRVGVAAAYELGKVPPEKRAAVIERAESTRLAQIEQEEKDEARYLAAEKKHADGVAKVEAAAKELEEARNDVTLAEMKVKETQDTLKTVQAEPMGDNPKVAAEKLKAAKADVEGSVKIAKDAKNKVAKLLEKVNVAEKAKPVKPVKGKATAVSPAAVKKAAKEEGTGTGAVPLTLSDIRQCLKDLGKAEDTTVKAIAAALTKCFVGISTTKELIHDLETIVGKAPVKK